MIVYSRFNPSRKEDFQLATLLEKEGDNLTAYKKAVKPGAEGFLQSLFPKYELLKKTNLPFEILAPEKYKDGVKFEYLNLETLDFHLYKALEKRDAKAVKDVFLKFKRIADQIASKNTEVEEEFIKIFGPLEGKWDCLSVGCVDINFDNIFVAGKDKYILFDYEWTFEFPVPKKFVLFRVVFPYYYKYDDLRINDILPIEEVLKELGITKEEEKLFLGLENNFQNYINEKEISFSMFEELYRKLYKEEAYPLTINELVGEREKYHEIEDKLSETRSNLRKLEEEKVSLEQNFNAVIGSKGWRLLEYLRAIRYPKRFMHLSIRLFKKIVKRVLPNFLVNIIRSVLFFYKEKKTNISLKINKFLRARAEKNEVVISVAIPIYDRTWELKEAIESILNQDYNNFELLLITDGSPIETLEVVRSYKEHPKVRIFEFGDRTGNSIRGRNKAILEARGKYLAFLDSDDIAVPSRLYDTVIHFEKTKADVVYGGYQFMFETTTRNIEGAHDGQKIYPDAFTMEDLKKGNYLCNSTSAAKTELLRKIGGLKPEMKYCEDYELWLRACEQGAKFAPLQKIISKLRIHDNNHEMVFKEEEKEWIKKSLEEYKTPAKLPKKIGYILPTTGIGGGVTVVLEHANRLKKRGFDVNVIVDPMFEDKYDVSWFPNQEVPIIRYDQAYGEYDILIATGWSTAYSLQNLKAKRKVYFVQSDETRFDDNKIYKERVRKTYRMNYEFMTEAKWIQKWLKKEFGKEAYLVPNAVNENTFFPDEPLERKSGKMRVLLEGPIDIPFKGMKEAFETVRDLNCEVWAISSLGQPKKEWRCDRFFEKVPQSELRRIYSSCDVLLKLSRVEGFFGPPLEMMACGGTAVVGDVTGYDEYIVDGKNALVVSLDKSREAENAIQKLIDNPKLLEKLKQEGLKTAKEMNWEKSADLLEKFFNKKNG